MIKINDALFYFTAGSKVFCNNAKDEDIVCVKQGTTIHTDRYNEGDVFWWPLDYFRQMLQFNCDDSYYEHKLLYNLVFAIRKEKGEITGDIPDDIVNYNWFDYRDEIIKCCIRSCEKYALHPRLTNAKNKDMCLKHSYWIFANYFALMNNSLEFTAEQLEIIQKCHDNELPKSYVEKLYNNLIALLPQQEVKSRDTSTTKSYEDIVNSKIRARYSISQEFAILRQRDTKPDEFNEYNAYCEQCKAEAKSEVHDENS